MVAVEEARASFERREWGEAYRAFAALAGDDNLLVDDLDRLATAAYLSGRDEEAFDVWGSTHHSCLRDGDAAGAISAGTRLAAGLAIKGDVGRSSGWVERTRRLVDDAGVDAVAAGYLDHVAGTCHIFETGDPAGARTHFTRARKVGQRFGDPELVALAQISEGRCLIYLGEISEGIALMDEAMVAVESDQVSPLNAGDAYCTVIDGCHEIHDVRRCDTWIESFTRWCDGQPELVLYRGQCLLHRADLMLLRGRWDEGVAEAHEACRRLAQPVNLLTLGRAHYLEGEFLRRRGRFAEAEEAYDRANEHGYHPQPGLSLLRLDQGDLVSANASIRRLLVEAQAPIARAQTLGAFAEIVLADGDVPAALVAGEELGTIATSLGSTALRAEADRAIGAAQLAQGNAAAALPALRSALRGFNDMNAPYEAARTRVWIARACGLLGDADGEGLERRSASATFRSLDAGPALAALDPGKAPDLPGGLTARELEILSLVASGMTNRAIAETLVVSEKTVASHVNHILTKLDVPSRAAATAFAYEHGLIQGSQHDSRR